MNTSRIILLKVGLMILKIREKDALAVVVLFCCSIYFVSELSRDSCFAICLDFRFI